MATSTLDTSVCPSDTQLLELLEGRLPDPVAHQHEAHLANCARCVERAETFAEQSLSSSDRLNASLRDADLQENSNSAADVHAVAQLVERLSQISPHPPRLPVSNDELRSLLSPPINEQDLGSIGRYRVLDVAGSGGMGIVFRALDPTMNRIIALKVMRPSLAFDRTSVQRFLREACAIGAVNHENVVTIFEVGSDRETPFFTMPWLEGETLRAKLLRHDLLSLTELLALGQQIALGLAAAHEKGIWHRDIKPDNIWINLEKHVRILDFGLAQVVESQSSLTHPGALLGTPAYMSPEQIRSTAIDGRSDLFALGCLLYHLAAGEAPFQGDHLVATLISVTQDQPPALIERRPELGPEFSDLVAQLMAKQPDQRPASARRVAAHLQRISESENDRGSKQNSSVARSSARLDPPKNRGWLGWIVASCFAFLFFAGVVHVVTDRGTLIIEADDEVAVSIQNEEITLRDQATGKIYQLTIGKTPLPSGVYEVLVNETTSGLSFSSREFAITRGAERRVKVTLESAVATVMDEEPGSIPDAPSESPDSDASPSTVDTSPSTVDTSREFFLSPESLLEPAVVRTELELIEGRVLTPLSLTQSPSARVDSNSWSIESVEHRGAVRLVRVSPDGERIATAGDDGTVRIWRTADQTLEQMISAWQVFDLAWSVDSEMLAISHTSETTEKWRPHLSIWRMGEQATLIQQLDRFAYQVRWSKEGLLAATHPGGLWFHRVDDLPVPSIVRGGQFNLGAQPFSPDGKSLVVQTQTGIDIVRLNGQVPPRTLSIQGNHPSYLRSQNVIVVGREVVVSGAISTTRQLVLESWDPENDTRLEEQVIGPAMVNQNWSFEVLPGDQSAVVRRGNEVLTVDLVNETESPTAILLNERPDSDNHTNVSSGGTGERIVIAFSDSGAVVIADSSLPIRWTISGSTIQYTSFKVTGEGEQRFFHLQGYDRSQGTKVPDLFWGTNRENRLVPESSQSAVALALSPMGDRLAVLRKVKHSADEQGAESSRDSSGMLAWNLEIVDLNGEREPISVSLDLPSQPELIWSPDGELVALVPNVNERLLVQLESDSSREGDVGSDDEPTRGRRNRNPVQGGYLAIVNATTGVHKDWVPKEFHNVDLRQSMVLGTDQPRQQLAAWSPDSTRIAFWQANSNVQIVRIADFTFEATLGVELNTAFSAEYQDRSGLNSERIVDLDWSIDGNRLLVTRRRNQESQGVRVWDVSKTHPELIAEVENPFIDQRGELLEFAPNPQGDWIAAIGRSEIAIIEVRTKQVLRVTDREIGARFAGWLSSGRELFLARSIDGKLACWNPTTGTTTLSSQVAQAEQMAVDPNHDELLVMTPTALLQFDASLRLEKTWVVTRQGLQEVPIGEIRPGQQNELSEFRVLSETSTGYQTLELPGSGNASAEE